MLILLSVMLLAAVGVIYFAEPAAASYDSGWIVVKKVTQPASSQAFSINLDGDGEPGFTLHNGEQWTSKKLYGDNYSIVEDSVAGWTLDYGQSSCDHGESINDIDLDNYNETVTCTLVNVSTARGTIIIDKVTDPPTGNNPDFDFEADYIDHSGADFSLDDNDTPRSDSLIPGTYEVHEINIPSDWVLTSATCSDGSPVSAISLQADETVTCTFTNTKKGTIKIDKVTVPATGNDPDFYFEADYIDHSGADFSLDDNDNPRSDKLAAGVYSVEEINLPADWVLDSATCSDGSPVSAIDLSPGEEVTCTFTNKLRLPDITVIKEIDRDGDGGFESTAGAGEYGFSLDGGGVVPTDANGQVVFSGVSGGPHTIAEAQLDSTLGTYVFKEGSGENCTFDGETATASPVEGSVTPGDCRCEHCCDPVITPPVDATCTFRNGPEPGRLTIVKQATPEDNTPFSFGGTITTPGVVAGAALRAAMVLEPFVLMDPSDNSKLFEGSGNYAITEGALGTGWQFDGVVCEGTDAWSHDGQTLSVAVGDGEEITCTFYNSGHGEIIVRKVVGTADAPAADFAFNSSYGAGFALADGESQPSGLLPAGVYSAAELLSAEQIAAGWELASATCNDGSGVNAIGVSVGETVTCTFENVYQAQPGYLRVVKVVNGGEAVCSDFSFSVDGGAAVAFEADCGNDFEFPAGGHHSVVEAAAADYTASYANCTDVEIVAGETAVCTITNTYGEQVAGPEGSLTILKVTVPAGGEGFSFDAGALGTFTLDDGGIQTFTELEAGAYTVTETPAADWEFASVECDALDYAVDGSSVTVNLAEGEAAICTFTNGELPYTGSGNLTMPLLIAGLWALLMGLAMSVWSMMRQTDKA